MKNREKLVDERYNLFVHETQSRMLLIHVLDVSVQIAKSKKQFQDYFHINFDLYLRR